MLIEKNNEQCLLYPLWVIDGVRYSTEIEFFKEYFNERFLLVRVEASNEIREKRGWNPQIDLDGSQAECQLDKNTQWSFVFCNNEEEENFNEQMSQLMKLIHS